MRYGFGQQRAAGHEDLNPLKLEGAIIALSGYLTDNDGKIIILDKEDGSQKRTKAGKASRASRNA